MPKEKPTSTPQEQNAYHEAFFGRAPGFVSIPEEIHAATQLGQALEDLVFHKVENTGFVTRTERDDILIGYWSLIFEYEKGILCLLRSNYPAPSAALLRPIVEALIKVHKAMIGTEQDVLQIRRGNYNVSYEKDGAQIDQALGLGSLLDDFLKKARPLLHSLTHSGKAQLWRRFDGNQVGVNFSDGEIAEQIGIASSVAFLVTKLIARHFGFDEELQAAEQLWLGYGARGYGY
ncbi:MAG TPA: hypothetical protein VK763_14425 [Terriglobales bacterium]|jgi:hypothetical protein|nr:hypothetical protein [Terriglobales bacterium]